MGGWRLRRMRDRQARARDAVFAAGFPRAGRLAAGRIPEGFIMSAHNSLVATYADHHLARVDIDKLRGAGFDLGKLRLVAQGYPIAVDGVPVVASLGELEPPWFECIPEHDLVDYEAELKAGRWLLVAHGSPDEIELARDVAESTHPTGWDGVADTAVYYGCAD